MGELRSSGAASLISGCELGRRTWPPHPITPPNQQQLSELQTRLDTAENQLERANEERDAVKRMMGEAADELSFAREQAAKEQAEKNHCKALMISMRRELAGQRRVEVGWGFPPAPDPPRALS